MIEQGLHTTFG